MTDIEFIEVEPTESETVKDVVAQKKSEEVLVQETKNYIQNLFRNAGVAE